jgi:hypothetical protein
VSVVRPASTPREERCLQASLLWVWAAATRRSCPSGRPTASPRGETPPRSCKTIKWGPLRWARETRGCWPRNESVATLDLESSM